MQLKIQNGVVELSGETILKSVNIEINDESKIAVVGRNGCGKTTLLKLISGEYTLERLDSDTDSFFALFKHLEAVTQRCDNVDKIALVKLAYLVSAVTSYLKNKADSTLVLVDIANRDRSA